MLTRLYRDWLARGWDLSDLDAFRMEEGDGDGDGGGGDGASGGDGGGAGTGAAGSSGDGTGGGGDGQGGGGSDAQDVSQLPDWAQKIIRDTRAEAATHRTAKKAADDERQATLKAVAKALGLETGDDPDPAKLAADLAAQQAENRRLKIEAAFAKAAKQHKADEDLTLAVLHRNGKLAELDPSAADFDTALAALVEEAVKANPKLKATPAAGKSGADLGGGGGGSDTKPKTLLDAVAAQMSG